MRYQRFDESRIKITAGESNLKTEEGTEQTRRVKKVIIHPNYDPELVYYDVAVVHLSEPLELNEFVEPLTIAEPGTVHEGDDDELLIEIPIPNI
jgi:hypothetical protein